MKIPLFLCCFIGLMCIFDTSNAQEPFIDTVSSSYNDLESLQQVRYDLFVTDSVSDIYFVEFGDLESI